MTDKYKKIDDMNINTNEIDEQLLHKLHSALIYMLHGGIIEFNKDNNTITSLGMSTTGVFFTPTKLYSISNPEPCPICCTSEYDPNVNCNACYNTRKQPIDHYINQPYIVISQLLDLLKNNLTETMWMQIVSDNVMKKGK